MSPKEYENYLHYQFEIPGKKGWSGIERSDFAKNWEPNLSQNIQTREEALKYLGVKETKKSPDGIEKRRKASRRTNQKDYRKNKVERRTLKQRREEERKDTFVYYFCSYFSLLVLLAWGCVIVYFLSNK